MTGPDLTDRIAGCLLGGACGDALGAPLEFLDSAAVRRLAPAAIAGMLPAYRRRGGAITDDTQMTLFSAEALIRIADSDNRGLDTTGQLRLVADAYLRWYETQTGRHRRSGTGLLAHRELFRRWAPGHTCLTALRKLAYDGGLRAGNRSKGCGSVMRAAPFGLVDRVDLAGPASRLTHGHPTATASSLALAGMVNRLVLGESLPAAVAAVLAGLAGRSDPDQRETVAALRAAVELAAAGPPSVDTVESLGGGWVAEEALAIAVLCALTGDGWEDTLVRAVRHGGDSDSTGAIAGNLLGAALGRADLPRAWLDTLDARSIVESTAALLAEAGRSPR